MTQTKPHEYRATKGVAEIRVRGRNRIVPSAAIQDRTVVVAGRWPRIASLLDEEFVDKEAFDDPASFFDALMHSGLEADLFTFIQRFPDVEPKYPLHMEWDSVAAIPVRSYSDWYNNQISGNVRKMLKRSSRRGLSVEQVDFSDDFVRGIVEIYNETPVRQHRAFWHYGKDFQTVKAETATYSDRSLFLGAFFEARLVGFLKMVFAGRVARLMHILSMTAYADKLPANALIAKAVEVCDQRGCTHLTYGKYIYGNTGHTSLTEFKMRNGFQGYQLPRYYVPLTVCGQLALRLGLHRGFTTLLPEAALKLLRSARAKYSLYWGCRAAKGRKDNPQPAAQPEESAGPGRVAR